MPETNFQKIFESLTMPWFYSNPIFFKLFCMQKLQENLILHIPFRVGKNLIEYNPRLLEKKSKESIRNDLILELTRIILHHPFRRPKNDKNFDKELWYEASTMTITQKRVRQLGLKPDMDIDYYYEMLFKLQNDDDGEESESLPFDTPGDSTTTVPSKDNDMKQNSLTELPPDISELETDSKSSQFAEQKTENTDEKKEEKEIPQKLSKEDVQEDKEKSKGLSDEKSQKKKEESSFSKEASELWSCDDFDAEMKMDNFVDNNRDSLESTPGTMAGMIEDQLFALSARKARIPSCVKLLEYFKSLRANNDYTLTRMRPSRRFGYSQMGKKRRPSPGKILIGVDVSGSIRDDMIIKFYHAISNVFDRGIKFIEIFQFDYELKTKEPVPFKKRSFINVHGRGGTNFQPLFDYIIKNQKKYDGLIVFTDGFAAEPIIHHKLYTKVLWVLYDKICYAGTHKYLSKTGFVTVLN